MSCFKTKYQQHLTGDEEKQCAKKMLTEDFPIVTYLACILCNMICGFCAIVFQFVLIAYKGPLYYIGAG